MALKTRSCCWSGRNEDQCDTGSVSTEESLDEKASVTLSDESDDSINERGQWTGKLDFLLSCVGYAVGLGNLWRFPYLCMRNGGGAFLIPYFIFLLLCGIPLYFLELALGQFSSRSPTTLWSVCPIFQGLGYAMILVSGLVCIYYNVIMAWAFYYIIKSFTAEQLPWATCDNWWNTEFCVERLGGSDDNSSNVTATPPLHTTPSVNSTSVLNATSALLSSHSGKIMTSAEEFWHYNVLQLSDSIDELGALRWELALCLLLAWTLVFFCMCKGIKSSGKVVYVTAIAPFIMLFIFLVRGLSLPGAWNGVKFYLTPDWDKLLDFQVWAEACAQIFYSLGVAYGSLIAMASYNRFHHDCYKYALVIPVINCGTSFLAGFTIFSVIGFMAHEANLPVKEVITSGPGLAFVAYPEALTKLPISPLWAILFFAMLVIIGLDTQFGMFECLVSGFMDAFPKQLMKRKTWFTAALCCLQLMLGLPLVTKGGIYIFQIFDWYSATFALISISLMECIAVAWIYGARRMYDDIEMMIGYKPCIWWRICWVILTPFILVSVLIYTIVQYKEPMYGDYVYPRWAIGFGWILALSSLVPVPLFAIINYMRARGTVIERLRILIKPAPGWGPLLKVNRTGPHYSTETLDSCTKPMMQPCSIDLCDESKADLKKGCIV